MPLADLSFSPMLVSPVLGFFLLLVQDMFLFFSVVCERATRSSVLYGVAMFRILLCHCRSRSDFSGSTCAASLLFREMFSCCSSTLRKEQLATYLLLIFVLWICGSWLSARNLLCAKGFLFIFPVPFWFLSPVSDFPHRGRSHTEMILFLA
jgi:hypothetical protein